MTSDHFAKVYGTILDSSIWAENDPTRILWITMLAMADSTGYIEAAVPGLAGRARIRLEDCEAALDKFQSPDPYSKNPEYEGRRVKKVDRGWQLLNYQEYREKRTESQVKRAQRQQRYREKKREEHPSTVDDVDANVDGVDANDRQKAAQKGEGRGEKGEGKRVVPSREGNKSERLPLAKMDLIPTPDRAIVAKSIVESLKQIEQIEIANKERISLQILSTFAYWVKKTGKDNARTRLTESRWARLKKYIQLYDIETCLYAIDGAMIHPHANQEGGKTFHEFPEIFMNKPEGPDRVEKLSEYARKRDKRSKHRFIEAHPQLEGHVE